MAAPVSSAGGMMPLLRMAAVDYLNPAPLMWNFEHPPLAESLTERYAVERMTPAACAEALRTGEADLGLIPIGAYASMPGLSIVPGCAIASLGAIRSLLLVFRTEEKAAADGEADFFAPTPRELARIGTVALDSSSRTTALYTQVLFRRFWRHTPAFQAHAPDLDGMLREADAAVLIGDPALFALRDRAARLARNGERLRYLDLGHAWREATETAWVSAVWAVRDAGIAMLRHEERAALLNDLQASRDAGLAHVPELVAEWSPRLGLPAQTVEHYIARNIHYFLDAPAIAGMERFFEEAHALGLLPSLPVLRWFEP